MNVHSIHIFDTDDLALKVSHRSLGREPFYTIDIGSIVLFCGASRSAEMAAKLRALADEIAAPASIPLADRDTATIEALSESRRLQVVE